jgi:hypothetical protein
MPYSTESRRESSEMACRTNVQDYNIVPMHGQEAVIEANQGSATSAVGY